MRRLFFIPLAIILGGGAIWYFKFSQPGTGATPKGAPPAPVLVSKATVQDMPIYLDVVGRAEAYESVSLKARVDGQVANVVFTEGQYVNEGQELLRLDKNDFELRLRQAEATVAKDEAQLAKAKADTERYLALSRRNFISEEKVNEIRTTEAALLATLNADKAIAGLARSQLSYTSLYAPFSGVVGAKLVSPGASVKANDTILATINRVRPIYAAFAIPEKHLLKLRNLIAPNNASCKQGGCLKAKAALPGEKNARYEGEVRFIDNAVDTATGMIQMKAVIDNKAGELTPGQYLNLTLVLNTLANSVVVPNEAVQQGADGTFVFVVNPQGTAEVRAVEVATRIGGLSAISKGLQSGETVVTDGQLRLTPGAKVVVKTAEAQPGAAAGRTAK